MACFSFASAKTRSMVWDRQGVGCLAQGRMSGRPPPVLCTHARDVALNDFGALSALGAAFTDRASFGKRKQRARFRGGFHLDAAAGKSSTVRLMIASPRPWPLPGGAGLISPIEAFEDMGQILRGDGTRRSSAPVRIAARWPRAARAIPRQCARCSGVRISGRFPSARRPRAAAPPHRPGR